MPAKKRKRPESPVRYDAEAAFAPASLKNGQVDFVRVSYRLNPEAQAFKEHLVDLIVGFVEHLGLSLSAFYLELGRRLSERQPTLALPAPVSAAEPQPRLTRRELEIVALMARRLTNEQIASCLVISINTMKTHVRHIHQKLGNRGQVLAWWEQHKHEYSP